MNKSERRKRYDGNVLNAMLRIYCRANHGNKEGLCADCSSIEKYAARRIQKCPMADYKTTCRKCAVHCYAPVQRDYIARVMRFSGPRMILRHPVMALHHLLKEML